MAKRESLLMRQLRWQAKRHKSARERVLTAACLFLLACATVSVGCSYIALRLLPYVVSIPMYCVAAIVGVANSFYWELRERDIE